MKASDTQYLAKILMTRTWNAKTYAVLTEFLRKPASQFRSMPADIEDMLQEIMIAIFKSNHGKIEKPKNWLTTVCRNTGNKCLRKKYREERRRAVLEAFQASAKDLESPAAQSVEVTYARRQIIQQVIESLNKEEDRRVLELCLEGKSPEQIADILGMTRKAVSNRLERLKKRLEAEAKERSPGILPFLLVRSPQAHGAHVGWWLVGVLVSLALLLWITHDAPAEPRSSMVAMAPVPIAENDDEPSGGGGGRRTMPLAPLEPLDVEVAATQGASADDVPGAIHSLEDRAPSAHIADRLAPKPPRKRAKRSTPQRIKVSPSTFDDEKTAIQLALDAHKRGDHETALAHVRAHAARFPSGDLAPRREQFHVGILCALGRTSEARKVNARLGTYRRPTEAMCEPHQAAESTGPGSRVSGA